MIFTSLQKIKNIIGNSSGLLFCEGNSFNSKLIRAKTRELIDERVPSHVAIIYRGFIYESTTREVDIGYKTIPGGVRRWLLKDYYKSEANKNTLYGFFRVDDRLFNKDVMEDNIHRPYGIDIILDIALKNGSDGSSRGLICSQYANLVLSILDKTVPTPAELMRACDKLAQEGK